MKRSLFLRLAVQGMKKNKRLYVPYLLTCIGMIMMYFLIQSISSSVLLSNMKGGSYIAMVLGLGKYVIAVFSLIFLLYTNSFLSRRRIKEFGLYNILGMDKRGVVGVVAWETILTALIGITIGILLGVAFNKYVELGLLSAIHREVDYAFHLNLPAVIYTIVIYSLIFAVLLIKSMVNVAKSNPLALLKSENVGEKPPKANWFAAVAGFVLLSCAYYMSVTIQSPLKAVALFFVAVIMVIIASYLLFTAGSVALCRMLQKKKSFYYRKNHFVAVSSMAYRMKRNGAGLASICVLCTMVLVMISSSASLYFGVEDMLDGMYPTDTAIGFYFDDLSEMTEDTVSVFREEFDAVLERNHVEPTRIIQYSHMNIVGLSDGADTVTVMNPDPLALSNEFKNMREIKVLPEKDYNRIMGTDISLAPGEAVLYGKGAKLKGTTLTIDNTSFIIVGKAKEFPYLSRPDSVSMPTLVLIVHDLTELWPVVTGKNTKDDQSLKMLYSYGFDSDSDRDTILAAYYEMQDSISDSIEKASLSRESGYSFRSECRLLESENFYEMYGSLFFIGIILSILFMFAAVLIIYYKQVSEGYEDQSRFEIMQKVGMTKDDIKKNINTQVLIVFFAPLLFAGLHLAFAYPMILKCMELFRLENFTLMFFVTVISYIVFGLFYVLVYKVTARRYYNIVSAS